MKMPQPQAADQKRPRKFVIVEDSREQLPLDFSPFADCRVIRAEIWPGDYSIQSMTNFAAIERKSVADFIGTMKDAYAGFGSTTPKRFDRELKALRGYNIDGFTGFIIIEPDVVPGIHPLSAFEQIQNGTYRSAIPPSKVLAFVKSIRKNWKVPVHFADSREHAARIVHDKLKAEWTLRMGYREFEDAK